MKVTSFLFTAFVCCLGAGPAMAQPGPGEPRVPSQFVAHLSGDEEVPARVTPAQGQFVAMANPDETSLTYRLMVANIQNVVAAHIHLAPAGANGPVVAFLAGPFPAGGGSANGVLAEGTVEAADLLGPVAGQALSVLLESMATGGAYVNVHTNDGAGDNNTGPGDFASGELRGQIGSVGRP